MRKVPSSIGRYISIIHRYFRIYLDRELREYNIGSGQFHILKVLYDHDGISQDEIGKYLNQDKSTTAKNIKKLVKEGYIIRRVDRADRRAYKIYLAEKARRIKPKILKILRRWTDILSTGFKGEEKEEALNKLSKMTENAQEFFSKYYLGRKNGK